jgi:hypothetical protein
MFADSGAVYTHCTVAAKYPWGKDFEKTFQSNFGGPDFTHRHCVYFHPSVWER